MTETALVAGSARCVFEDLAHARTLAPDAQIIAVNMTGLVLPALLHLASLHAEFIAWVATGRLLMDTTSNPKGERVQVHSTAPWPGVDRVWAGLSRGGSSGLFGVRVALALGFARVICAGIPLDSSGRFFDAPGPPRWPLDDPDCGDPYRAAWMHAAEDEFAGRVTSCSGWTRTLLGAPA